MKTKNLRALSVWLATVFLAAVLAGGAGAAFATGGSSGDTTTGEVELTKYEIQDVGGANITGQFEKDTHITLVLYIVDRRYAKDDYTKKEVESKVKAWVNTTSFTIPSDRHISVDANEGNPQKYKLTFSDLTYTGEGSSFRCDISFGNYTGSSSVDLEISQAISTTQEEEDGKNTSFVLQQASYGSEQVNAGAQFTLSATLLATDGKNNVENVTVGVTPPQEIAIENGASIQYVGTVTPGQSIPVAFVLKPNADIEEGSYTIELDVKGIDAKSGSDVTASVSVTVPVFQPERFAIYGAQIPTYLTVGLDDGSGYGEITLVNEGKGSVNNVAVDIEGEGLSFQEGKQYVGNVAGGEQKTAEFTLQADKAGTLKGTIVISYENGRGEKKELMEEFTLEAAEEAPTDFEDGLMIDEGLDYEEEPEEGIFSGPLLIVIVVAACVVAAIVVTRIVRKRRAEAAAAEEEELLDDED
jgi:hypothetical protein